MQQTEDSYRSTLEQFSDPENRGRKARTAWTESVPSHCQIIRSELHGRCLLRPNRNNHVEDYQELIRLTDVIIQLSAYKMFRDDFCNTAEVETGLKQALNTGSENLFQGQIQAPFKYFQGP